MPSIDINAKVKVDGGTPNKPGGGNSPGGTIPDSEIAKREAAARRALTQRMGKTFTDAQIAQVARDFTEMSKFSQRLKRYGGDMEKWANGFSQTFPGQRQANRHYNEVMQQLGLGPTQQQSGGIGGMLRTAFGGMFRATGAGGGVASGILHQGYRSAQDSDGGAGSAGGMGMIGKAAGIAALAYVGIKAVQKVGQKVGDAQDEATQYHDLRMSVGGAAVGFDELRESVRLFTNGMGISSAESAKLAKQYAASSQIFGESARFGIGQAVGQGTQLSRGLGLAPEAGVDFLATMRHFKASDGEKDNRKLAYLIGDAVGKTGAFSKADEVMSAIAHFTESTSRQSLQVANVEGYAELMGKLGGMKLPGMDARGSANLMGQVAGNWANGGGEAGMNMRLGWAQRFGANATDMGAIGDAGPWASAQSTFGKNSPLYKLADGDKARQAHLLDMAKRGGSKSFYDRDVDEMKSSYSPEFLPMAMMGKYGVSDIGARSLIKQHGSEGGIGGLQERIASALSGTGKDASKISLSQMGMLAAIDQGDSKELATMKEKALGLTGNKALTAREKDSLNGATTEDGLKKVLTQINAFREIEDEGKAARQAQVDLDRKFQEFATKIIPLTNMIQEGVFKILDLPIFGGLSKEMKEFQANKEYQKNLDEAPNDAAKKAVHDKAMAKGRIQPMSEKEFKERSAAIGKAHSFNFDGEKEELDALRKERERRANAITPSDIKKEIAAEGNPPSAIDPRAAHEAVLNSGDGNPAGTPSIKPNLGRKPAKGSGLSDSEKAYLAETDRLLGAAPGTSEAQIMVESQGDHNAVSPRGAKGLGQIMPREQGVMEARLGRKIATRADQLEAHRLMMQENLGKFKTNDKAQKAYNGGWDESKWGNKETSEYTDKIAAYREKQIPDAARPAIAGNQIAKVGGSVDLNVNYPDGRTEKKAVELSGFQQTSAGMSRG